MTPTSQDRFKFDSQKYHVERSGTPFNLTFQEWWAWWQQTGHYHERGQKSGQYVMARVAMNRPYELGNLLCITKHENTRRIHLGRRKEKVPTGTGHTKQATKADRKCTGQQPDEDPGLTMLEAITLMRLELARGGTPNRVPMCAKPLNKADFVDPHLQFAAKR